MVIFSGCRASCALNFAEWLRLGFRMDFSSGHTLAPPRSPLLEPYTWPLLCRDFAEAAADASPIKPLRPRASGCFSLSGRRAPASRKRYCPRWVVLSGIAHLRSRFKARSKKEVSTGDSRFCLTRVTVVALSAEILASFRKAPGSMEESAGHGIVPAGPMI